MLKNNPQWVDVKTDGENTGLEYFGRFSVKPFLSHKERSDAVRLAEAYCRGIRDDMNMRNFLTTQAFLKFHVVESDADWWSEDGTMDTLDENPVYAIAEKIRDVQDSFKPKKDQEKQVVEEKETKKTKKG